MSPNRSIRASCWRGSARCFGARTRRRAKERHTAGLIRFDRWTLDTAQRELKGPDGVIVPLSAGEFALLLAFIERPNISLSRDQLLDITRGRNAEPFDRSVDNAVSRLRRKIEEDPRSPRLIKTVWGGGYVFATTILEK